MHYYKPGHKDEMHCHNADQTFYVIDGECTMHFPDGGKAVLTPGMAATITGGSFYQLENASDKPMIMMGNRSGPSEKIQIIDYVTRKISGKRLKTKWRKRKIPFQGFHRFKRFQSLETPRESETAVNIWNP